MKKTIYNILGSVWYDITCVLAMALSFILAFAFAAAGCGNTSTVLLYTGVGFLVVSLGSMLLQDILYDRIRAEEQKNQNASQAQHNVMRPYIKHNDPIQTAFAVYAALDGREDDFGPKGDAFLRQFGIRRLTGLRDSWKDDHAEETDLDRAIRRQGLTGCVNDTDILDFVIEKNGVQMYVYIQWGIWNVGRQILLPGSRFPRLLSRDEVRSYLASLES